MKKTRAAEGRAEHLEKSIAGTVGEECDGAD